MLAVLTVADGLDAAMTVHPAGEARQTVRVEAGVEQNDDVFELARGDGRYAQWSAALAALAATVSAPELEALIGHPALRKADLAHARMSGACLAKADLSGANLYRAYLDGADLREANLAGANLELAVLGGVEDGPRQQRRGGGGAGWRRRGQS